ncbi:hypothetical protein MUK42_02651 [Musa troglodytarum]|uniref:Uncharacterized protein n=1 Tax=Musa troglodytarum TaxID=320322 RepID=A0A9E7JKF5_9LILI|nr:hypothetical protein MUK42_02651 [Musa troglodytarum]
MSFGGDGVGRKIRSQPQQLFSQGMSLSRSSPGAHLRGNQRCGSQEKDNSRKRIFSLAPIASTREESQLHLSRAAGIVCDRMQPLSQITVCCCTTDEEQGGTPLLNREEGKSKSVKLKLTESKHNMRHRHEFPHRRQMIFLRKGEQFNGENSGRQYENPKGN